MGALFDDKAFEQLMYWVREDRKIAAKIHSLINDIHRNGISEGIGKPEHLKRDDGWSRRIDHENRLVYDTDKDGNVRIISCKGHYED